MNIAATTRIVANPELKAGDKIVTSDGMVTCECDAAASSTAPGMVCVDVPAGTLYLPAAQTSEVLVDTDGDEELDVDHLLSRGYTVGEAELFSLGLALGHGRSRGLSDADTIAWFCLADVEDRERLAEHTGKAEDELKPTAETALAFVKSYWDTVC